MSPDSERCARRGPQPLDHSEGGIGASLTQAGDVAPLAAKYVPRVRSARREASCSCGMWPRRERVRGRMAMLRNGGGPRGQSRSSALWGTGNNDDSRSNALWGKGGRGLVTMMAAVLVLGIPLAASAGSNGSSSDPGQETYVSPGMLAKAAKHPNATIHVIVTANEGDLPKGKILVKALGHLDRQLNLVDGIALDLPAKRLAELSQIEGLTITPDAPAHPTGLAFTSKQLWVPNTGIDKLWNARVTSNPADT